MSGPDEGRRYTRPAESKAVDRKLKELEETAAWEDFATDLPDIPDLAQEFMELKGDMKIIEDRLGELKPTLEAAVVIGGKKSLLCPGYKITQGKHPGNPQFKPELLVEKLASFGLKAEQITEAVEFCVVRKPYTYPVVSRVGGATGE